MEQKKHQKQNREQLPFSEQLRQSVINQPYDLAVLWDRAAHYYGPQIFEYSLGLSCYNAGSDGMCIYYHYGILASRIQRECPPKMVVLDVISTDVEASQGATFSLDAALERFAPHYGQFAGIDSMYAYNG